MRSSERPERSKGLRQKGNPLVSGAMTGRAELLAKHKVVGSKPITRSKQFSPKTESH